MIGFNEVVKVYRAKSGKEFSALNGVSFTLPDRGMVFLCGRSGSGKTTLLNLLGGLDKPTSGTITYNGNALNEFSDSQLSSYRKEKVGFVFQEFNLIDSLNVEQNLEIALSLQGNKNKTIIPKTLETVGLESHIGKQIAELSGGEKQRVSIARALIKNPSIILADEPTGSLDPKTGTAIFDLLKGLSIHRLVVVVTHDVESAKKYHDYLIEIEGGEIIFNNCVQQEERQEDLQFIKPSVPLLPFAKIGARNLRNSAFRSISTILTAMLAIFTIVMAQLHIFYSRTDVQASIIASNNITAFAIEQHDTDEYYRPLNTLKPSSVDYLQEKTAGLVAYSDGIVVKSSADVIDFGFEFVGEFRELDNNSVYLTENGLEKAYENVNTFFKDGNEYIKLTKHALPKASVYNATFREGTTGGYQYYTVAGIIRTASHEPELDPTPVSTPFYLEAKYFLDSYVNFGAVVRAGTGSELELSLSAGDKHYGCKDFSITGSSPFSANSALLASGTIVELNSLSLTPSQIILSLPLYNSLFGLELTRFDLVEVDELAGQTAKLVPPHLASTISLSMAEQGYLLSRQGGEYELAGVQLSDFSCEAILEAREVAGLKKIFGVSSVIINSSSVNVDAFLRNCARQGLFASTPYDNYMVQVDKDFAVFTAFFIVFGAILGLVMVMLVVNTISLTIKSRTREIGVLMALGANDRTIFAIYLIEALILATIVFVLCLILTLGGIEFFNFAHLVAYGKIFRIFSFSAWNLLTIFLSSFGAILLASSIPLLKIKKLNPIDAIKTTT